MNEVRMLSKGEAYMIFNDIENSKYTNEEKVIVVYTIMNMETHNSVTKADMLNVIRWMWNSHYEVER